MRSRNEETAGMSMVMKIEAGIACEMDSEILDQDFVLSSMRLLGGR